MLRISHRGQNVEHKENTIRAFESAIALNADMIEIDIRLYNDNLYVSHDSDKIDSKTLNIDDAIDFLKNKCEINLEIKNPNFIYPNITNKVLKCIKKHNVTKSVLITSFNHYIIESIIKINKGIRTGILYSSMFLLLQDEVEMIKPYAILPEIDIAFGIDTIILNRKGYKVYTWVANTKSEIHQAINFKYIDGVMVNDLNLFKGLL